ncbi:MULTISPECIES: ABC transporter ATP-binding protein [Streptomonospora]|uniref:ABC transporter ATP-binding protein n=2 Tax=Streptomonospora TaxID=104204 RepID=A0ABV9SS00_9ACTN
MIPQTEQEPRAAAEPDGGDAITVAGVSKSFGPVRALRDVDFSVRRGEIFGLLGPNGAGKTTLVEILEGHGVPDRGSVRVLGLDPRKAGARLRDRLGIVPQQASFELYLTVREHLLAFGGYYRSSLPVDELIDLVGLGEKRRSLVGRLSGGQQRRLDLALALVGDPDVIFLDEPTTGFDVEARDRAWRVVEALRAAGKTIVLTTHNMDEAQKLVDRVAVLYDGSPAAIGTPAELLADQGSRIGFRAGAITPADLPERLAGLARAEDGRIVLVAQDAAEALHELTGWARANDHTLPDLEVSRPDIEDLYLSIVGAQTTRRDTALTAPTGAHTTE